ncbi:hypothetical protein KDH_26410 [Dictyobacter sp. S3.2.2.5]|uniref:Uncharacterized protein n=1 Tax=Dictyobacter halimunensis TaxID=3026934 RepID=A0ABQ6FPZ8_9CHLR|nr:hypothetical protein KDH_26410 [Dictyobacter sp. S3.2.2.5]
MDISRFFRMLARLRFPRFIGDAAQGLCLTSPINNTPADTVATATLTLNAIAPGNLFESGQQMALMQSVQDTSGQGGTYTLSLTVQDAYGTTVARYTDHVVLTPNGTFARQVMIDTQKLGWYNATAMLQSASTVVATASSSLALLPPPVNRPEPASPWGIGGGGAWLGIRFDENGAARSFQRMYKAGIAWSREELFWNNLEPSQGTWNWAAFDASMLQAREHHVLMMGLLDYWASWSIPEGWNSRTDTIDWQTALANFTHFCYQVVNRYKPGGVLARQMGWTDGYGIHYWEIWNEPTTSQYWRSDGTHYGLLLKAAKDGIKRADPDAFLIGSNGGTDFDQQAIQVAGITSYDAIAIHIYASRDTTPEATNYVKIIQSMRSFLNENGGQHVEIWLTETGWDLLQGVSAWDQANFIVRAQIASVAAGVARSFIFTLQYAGEGWGLMTDNGEPRLSYTAYATLTDQFRGLQPAGEEPMGAALRAYIYAGDDRVVGAVWSVAQTGTLEMDVEHEEIEVYDLMNTLVGRACNGHLTVDLTGSPRFLRSRTASAARLGQIIREGKVIGIVPPGIDIATIHPADE